jgi:hypothetical protein
VKIERYDSPDRFLVSSLTNPDNVHLVDMEEYDGYGECSCEYWHFNLGPKLKNGEEPAKACRHIIAVRNMLARELKNKFKKRLTLNEFL